MAPSSTAHFEICCALFRKHHLEQLLRALQSVQGEHHRLCLADRIIDHSLLVQSVHGVPVKSLPRSVLSMKPKIKQRQHRVIDSVLVDCHSQTSRDSGTDESSTPIYQK